MTNNTDMNIFLYLNKYSICNELCDEIIEMFNNQEEGKYDGLTAEGLNSDVKNTTDFQIIKNDTKWGKIHQFLEKELINNYKKYLEILNNYNNITNNEIKFNFKKIQFPIIQMQKYEKNKGKYIYHNDFAINYSNSTYRLVTFLWYLNTIEDGGETEFWGEYKIKPEKGKLLFFPACWTFPHGGKIPISDDKYIITGWIYV